MRLFKTSPFPLVFLGVFVCGFSFSALSQTVRVDNDPPYDIAIALRNVTLHDGKVTGQIVNTSPHDVRDIQLFIRQTWLWKNEFKPGPTARDPSRAQYITIGKQLKHGQSEPFSYILRPRQSSPSAGEFMTEVSIAGFTEVVYPKG